MTAMRARLSTLKWREWRGDPQGPVAIPSGVVQNGVDFSAFNVSNPSAAVLSWNVVSSIGSAPAGVKAQVVTSTAAAAPPFVRVDFIIDTASPNYSCYYGSTSMSTSFVDVGPNRTWTFLAPITGSTSCAVFVMPSLGVGRRVTAIGITGSGDGLATQFTTLLP